MNIQTKKYSFNDFAHTDDFDRVNIINKEENIKINDIIRKGEELLFFPHDIKELTLSDDGQYGIRKYKLCIFGLLYDMNKCALILDGIEPYFDIKLDANNEIDAQLETEEKLNIIKGELNKIGSNKSRKVPYSNEVTTYDIFKSKYYLEYAEEQSYFARYFFLKNNMRCKIIEKMTKEYKYSTSEDDNKNNFYYSVFLRTNDIKMGEWITIKNYQYYNEFIDFKVPVLKTHYTNICNTDKIKIKRVLCLYWDIETYTSRAKKNVLPDPNNDNDNVFMISSSLVWSDENESLINICFVDTPVKEHNEFIIVECGSEKNVIIAFFLLISKIMPEYLIGFNDSAYDWKWIVYRAYIKYPGVITDFEKMISLYSANYEMFNSSDNLDKKILDNCFKSIFVDKTLKFDKKKKTDNNNKYADKLMEDMNLQDGNPRTLKFDGIIPFDLRTILRKKYPEFDKSNLDFYLETFKLPKKEDMPIPRLFQIYHDMIELINNNNDVEIKANNDEKKIDFHDSNNLHILQELGYEELLNKMKAEMSEVAYYCVKDSFNCHGLIKKLNILLNIFELANIGYVSCWDIIRFEAGVRVRNATMREYLLHGISGSNLSHYDRSIKKNEKYSGAFVFNPKIGNVNSKLTIDERIQYAKKMSNIQ